MAAWDALLGYLDTWAESERWNFPGIIGHPWDSGYGLGTTVSLTYSFMNAVPAYDGYEHPGFATPSATLQSAIRSALAAWSAVANVTFTQVPDAGDGGQIRIGMMDIG